MQHYHNVGVKRFSNFVLLRFLSQHPVANFHIPLNLERWFNPEEKVSPKRRQIIQLIRGLAERLGQPVSARDRALANRDRDSSQDNSGDMSHARNSVLDKNGDSSCAQGREVDGWWEGKRESAAQDRSEDAQEEEGGSAADDGQDVSPPTS